MAKWDVVLTVIALYLFVGVLSQTNINTPNATVEENNDSGTSLNINAASVSPSISINEETAGKEATSDSAGHSQPTNNQTSTSTFPPLIHNSHPQDATTSTQSTVSTTPTTSQTTRMPIHEEEKSVTQKSQTDKINAPKSTPKGNSSNMLHSSVIVLATSILIWKLTY